MKASSQPKWPKWNNPPFPHLSGLLDGLLRKAKSSPARRASACMAVGSGCRGSGSRFLRHR